jgi:radical SAM protein with 4Fe4S-binding SPASM domain
MTYRKTRIRKYYDALRSNNSFLKTNLVQKTKIVTNILKFLKTNLTKPLVLKNKPVIAQIEPTSLCNLKCEMCIRDKIGVPIGSMNFEDFKKILDKLDSLFKVHLSGQGEPFINPDIFKMIDYANKRGITVFFTTNATKLSKEVIDKICRVEIGEIGISIDSTKKEKYEKIRKGANFEEVKNNIKNLVEELRKNGKKTILSTATVIMKNNLNEVSDFVILAKDLGIKKIGFQTMQEKEDYIKKYGSEAKKQAIRDFNAELKEKIKEAKILADKYKISLIFDQEKSTGCIWPWRSIYITWNGYVTPCCKILDYRKPYFGNILKEDFWKIWNGESYQGYRKLLRERKAPSLCKGCSMI